MQGTQSYVSALLVTHGGLSRVDAEAFAVDLTRQITFDRALRSVLWQPGYDETKKILNSTTAYKEKFLPSGEFDKSKSRLFAGGYMQVDESSGESSAPTARLDTRLRRGLPITIVSFRNSILPVPI